MAWWNNIFSEQKFFNDEEQKSIVEAIRIAEQNTSGEIRVYVEGENYLLNPIDRAAEIFKQLKMENTKDRNAVLLYIAYRHRELSIYADENIYTRLGKKYWKEKVAFLVNEYHNGHYANSLIHTILQIGATLKQEFPYDRTSDKNELPDEIVFGK